MLTLDVVLPTYNRADLLPKTLQSLMTAPRPAELGVTVWVIDNNSKDNTKEIVQNFQKQFSYPLQYWLERQQGYSAALNAGIRAGSGDLIAMINDDEQVDTGWFRAIYQFFSTSNFDFAGGPYYPDWQAPKPDWITKENGGIVGWVDGGPNREEYGPGFNGILMGGNSVVRRRAFDRVGLYNTALGRTDKGLASCEDEDMYARLLAAGLRGMYLPDLIIHHHIPATRMTKSYHRRWCLGRGTSLGKMSRMRAPDAAQIFGIPRWRIRQAIEGFGNMVKGWLRLDKSNKAFQGELHVWDFVGFLNGRFLSRPQTRNPVETSASELRSDSVSSRQA